MEFSIFSIGDAAFLEQVLMSVAMISGAGDFETAAGIGLLVGVLIVFFQTLSSGSSEIKWGQLIVCWIAWSFMYGTDADVTIESAYTGEVRVVSNVPGGIAAMGSMISNVGYGITELMEQGYTYISEDVSDTKPLEALKLLTEMKEGVESPKIAESINQVSDLNDFDKSWMNYIKECTLTAIDLGITNPDKIATGVAPDAYQFNSTIFGTEIYTNANPTGEYLTCNEAYTKLTTEFDAAVSNTLFDTALTSQMGLDARGTSVATPSAIAEINDTLTMLGASSTTAQKYIQATMLQGIFDAAVQGKYHDLHDTASAIAYNQAITQRNTQWASEQSMFQSLMLPMMSFFEGFVYAITPIMGVIILMGGKGTQLAVKYLALLLWVQLWTPITSIINLYMNMTVSGELTTILGATTGWESFYAVNIVDQKLRTAIATGGMLYAATPALSLMLLYGGAVSASHLAGRMQGGDHFNEKVSEPDAINASPIVNGSSLATHNAQEGTLMSGGASAMSNFNLSNMASNGLQQAKTNSAASQEAFQKTVTESLSQSAQSGTQVQALQSIGNTWSSDTSTSYGKSIDTTTQKLMAMDYTESQAKAMTAQAGLRVLNIGAGGSMTENDSLAQKEVDSLSRKLSEDKSFTSTAKDTLAKAASSSSGDSWASSLSESQQESISKSASHVLSSQETESTLRNLSNNAGLSQEMSPAFIGTRLSGHEGSDFRMAFNASENNDMKEYAQIRADEYQTQFGGDRLKAEAAARFEAATYYGDSSLNAALTPLNIDSSRNVSSPVDMQQTSTDTSNLRENNINGVEDVNVKESVDNKLSELQSMIVNSSGDEHLTSGIASTRNPYDNPVDLIESAHVAKNGHLDTNLNPLTDMKQVREQLNTGTDTLDNRGLTSEYGSQTQQVFIESSAEDTKADVPEQGRERKPVLN